MGLEKQVQIENGLAGRWTAVSMYVSISLIKAAG
jgi:hypothetical protein